MSRKRRDREYLADLAEAVQRIVAYDGRGSEKALCPGKTEAPAPALETNGRDVIDYDSV